MDIKAIFIYQKKTIEVSCSSKEEMVSLFNKFIKQVNPESNINNYIFYYEGKELGKDSTIEKNELISGKSSIAISVQKNLKIIKCPQCNYNDCIINLSNYQVTFYGCEHKHIESDTYDKYNEKQKIENSSIRCCVHDCDHNEENDTLDFYLCLTCSKMLNNTNSYCSRCNSAHNKDHIRVKFDDKNYYCRKHFNKYEKYCFTCQKNICEECVNEHAEHKIKSYESMLPTTGELEELNKNLKTMEENIENLKIIIENILYNLNGTLRIFQKYYQIAKEIIGKYKMFNQDFKNYTILKTLRHLKLSNRQIMLDLKEIIDNKSVQEKAKAIIDIYKNKKDKYKSNKNTNDMGQDKDEDWIKEIEQKSKNGEKGLKNSNIENRQKKKIKNKTNK